MARRVRVYLFGVILGCVMSYFFLKRGEHDFTFWLPENRVLAEISDSMTYAVVAKCYMECYSIDEKSIEKLLTDGDVNFSESLTKKAPKIYQVEGGSISGKKIAIRVKMMARYAEVITVKLLEGDVTTCDC